MNDADTRPNALYPDLEQRPLPSGTTAEPPAERWKDDRKGFEETLRKAMVVTPYFCDRLDGGRRPG
jgi:hypothetical protein